MAQDYVLRSFKKEDFQDAHGNYWCTAAFEGVGEPVKWVVKNPMSIQEGQTYYGEIKELTSKAGKPYMRFYKQQKPDGALTSSNAPSERSGGYKDNSDGQRQGMCINNAATFITSQNTENTMTPAEWAEMVYEFASALYQKGELKAAETAKPDVVITDINEDEPINLNDIPF